MFPVVMMLFTNIPKNFMNEYDEAEMRACVCV